MENRKAGKGQKRIGRKAMKKTKGGVDAFISVKGTKQGQFKAK